MREVIQNVVMYGAAILMLWSFAIGARVMLEMRAEDRRNREQRTK